VAQGNTDLGPRALLDRFGNEDASTAAFDLAALQACLEELGAFAAIQHASAHRRTAGDMRKHLHDHFDAFRCLKLAHALRDRAHPSLPLREALARAPFLDVDPNAPLPALCEHLAALEGDGSFLEAGIVG
jgi:hypothetical protein